jgi:hypothetical protein
MRRLESPRSRVRFDGAWFRFEHGEAYCLAVARLSSDQREF